MNYPSAKHRIAWLVAILWMAAFACTAAFAQQGVDTNDDWKFRASI